MSNSNYKNNKIFLIGSVVFFVLIFAGAICFEVFKYSTKTDVERSYVFDGWVYSRDDQKIADVALHTAGLDNYLWQDGKLLAPTTQRSAYQTALSSAGAYPKVPSDIRFEALKDMSIFESETKTDLREFNACSVQLERTVEQINGIEYATVGARTRRERSGLTSKNVVTVSIGIACKDNFKLTPNMISAIVIAAKHQLGIDNEQNISILDLKEGKSYLGKEVENVLTESSYSRDFLEKERIEKYWRDKYVEAFGDIKNIRVSVTADVTFVKKNLQSDSGDFSLKDSTTYERLTSSKISLTSGVQICKNSSKKQIEEKNVTLGRIQLGNPRKDVKRNNRQNNTNTDSEYFTVPESYVQSGSGQSNTNFVVTALKKGDISLDGKECSKAETDSDSDKTSNCVGKSEDISVDSLSITNLANSFTSESWGTDSGNGKVRFANAEIPLKNNDDGSIPVLQSIFVQIAIPHSYARQCAHLYINEQEKNETYVKEPSERQRIRAEVENNILEETKRYAMTLFLPTSKRLGWEETQLEKSFAVSFFSDLECTEKEEREESDTVDSSISDFEENTIEVASNYPSDSPRNDFLPNVDDFIGKTSEILGIEAERAGDADEERTIATKSLEDNKSVSNESPDSDDKTVSSGQVGIVADVSGKVTEDMSLAPQELEEQEGEFIDALFASFTDAVETFLTSLESKVMNNPKIRNSLLGVILSGFFVLIARRKTWKNRGRRNTKREFKKEDVNNSVDNTPSNTLLDKERLAVDLNSEDEDFSNHSGICSNVKISHNVQMESPTLDRRLDVSRESGSMSDYDSQFSDFDDELDGELLQIAKAKTGMGNGERLDKNFSSSNQENNVSNGREDDYWEQRQKALELISRFPERAAESLQGWVRRTNS